MAQLINQREGFSWRPRTPRTKPARARLGVEAMAVIEEGERRLIIVSESVGKDVRIVVSDSGPGFACDQVEEVFTAFYTTKVTGLGMGLSICRSIIEAHDGHLWAEANAPCGARVVFTLPGCAGR